MTPAPAPALVPAPAQQRRASFAEAVANVVLGYVVALLTQRIVFPLFAIETTLTDDSLIAAIFALVSLVRSYALRRLFLVLEHREALAAAQCRASLYRRLASGKL